MRPGVRPEPDPRPDEQLLVAIRAGDRAALAALLYRYQERLFGLCVRMMNSHEAAVDLTQDCLVKIIRGLHTFDGKAQLSTWITRVAMNVCLSKLRSEKYRRHASLDTPLSGGTTESEPPSSWAAVLPSREPGPDSSVYTAEDRQRLLQALALLDPEARAIILLRDSHGLEYDQIAEVLGIALGTVKSRLFRARSALRELIESRPAPGKGAALATPTRRGSASDFRA